MWPAARLHRSRTWSRRSTTVGSDKIQPLRAQLILADVSVVLALPDIVPDSVAAQLTPLLPLESASDAVNVDSAHDAAAEASAADDNTPSQADGSTNHPSDAKNDDESANGTVAISEYTLFPSCEIKFACFYPVSIKTLGVMTIPFQARARRRVS